VEVLKITAMLLVGMFSIRMVAAFSFLSFIQEKRHSLLIALALTMPLTLMIAIATIAHESEGMITFHEYNAVILASLLEVIISMIGIKLLAK